MFTGIVEEIGRVTDISPLPSDPRSRRLKIAATFGQALVLGESVSVQGTCLTVVDSGNDWFAAEVSPTTLQLTTLGSFIPGRPVNLERSVTPSTRLGGHWVQGHIDGTGRVQERRPEGSALHLTVAFAAGFGNLVLPKGSVAIDGVSLTVVERQSQEAPWLECTIIPHTQAHTTLGMLAVDDAVNLEFDILGKYVQSLLTPYLGGSYARHGEAPDVSTES